MQLIGPISALGTAWWFEVFDEAIDLAAVEQYLTKRLGYFDDTYSRFKTDSVVSILNRTGTLPSPTAELRGLLTVGQDWYQKTGGAFNFLSAGAQVGQGYGHSATIGTNTTKIANPVTDLLISEDAIVLTEGAIDLGGFGKGWLIDALAAELKNEFDIKHILINGGGDMWASNTTVDEPITISVEHPYAANTYIAEIPLSQQAFAASSTYKRHWQVDKKAKTHILNPLADLDYPITPVASHVVTANALTADIVATILCINPELLMIRELECEYCILVQDEPPIISPKFKSWLL